MEDGTEAEEQEQRRVDDLINAGSDIAGSAAGAALGFLGGGPAGAVIGGAATGPLIARSLRWAASELKKRFLGPREEVRVGAVMAFAVASVRERLKAGQQLRSDDFFSASKDERSSGDEIVEATLLAAQRDHEERKLPYLGSLLAAIAFDQNISRAEANQLIQQFERLSYRQLVMLSLIAKNQLPRDDDFRAQGTFSRDLTFVLTDALDLYNRGLINNGGEVMFGPSDFQPRRARVQAVGAEIYNLAGLGGAISDDNEAQTIVGAIQSAPPKAGDGSKQ